MENKVMPRQNIKWPGSIDIGKFYFEYFLKGPSNKANYSDWEKPWRFAAFPIRLIAALYKTEKLLGLQGSI